MAAAAVVVANPVVPPRSDVQIPAVQLSAGAGDALGMLDEDFLKAIAPAPPESTNPFVILKDLITSLAADATHLGKNAIVDAFVAGATAVTQPELTAASLPYVPGGSPSQSWVGPVGPLPEVASPLSLEALLPVDLAVPSGSVPDLTPVVAEVVTAVVNDVTYVGNQLVTAAFAAGAVLADEPRLIVETLRALISGDIRGALESAVEAVSAPFGPPRMILDAIHTVVTRYLPVAPAVTLPAVEAPTPVEAPAPGASVAPPPANPLRQDGPSHRRVVLDTPLVLPRPVASVSEDAGRALGTDSDLSDLHTVPPAERAARPGPVGRALTTVAEQARTALRDAGDAVRQATGRTAKGASTPSGE